jgi:outer membrane receptor protein involved in Fe transport
VLDGVPQVDPFGGWVSWSAFQPERLGLVRVTHGGGSGAYGPGALAGTIELMSAGPTQLAPVWGGFAYGSRDSIDADAGLSGELGGGFASLSANYARGDGFTPIVRESRGPVDRPAPYEQASAAARAVIPVNGDTELQANGMFTLDRRDRGVDFTDNRNIGADASLRLVSRGRWGWEAVTWLQMREFSSGFASVNAARTTVSPSLDQYNVPATGLGARFEIRPPLGDTIQLRIGGDARQTQGQTKEKYLFTNGVPANRREAGGRTRTIGAFTDLSIEATDALTLTGGARIDRWWIENGFLHQHALATGATLPGTTDFADRSGWEPTARAGLAFKPTAAITLRGAGYLGWRLPTLNELYRPFRVGSDTTTANAALKPERLKGVDAGIDYRLFSIVHLGATIFYNELDDAIANVTTAVTPQGTTRQRRNLDSIRSQGVELEAGLDLADWSLSASYAYVDAKVRASGAALALDGLRPAQTPRHFASATLAWAKPAGPGASVTLRYVGGQFEDDQNSRTLNDALTVDASAAIPLAAGVSLDLRAENLANKRVEAGVSGANLVERATPRTLWVGLRYAAR